MSVLMFEEPKSLGHGPRTRIATAHGPFPIRSGQSYSHTPLPCSFLGGRSHSCPLATNLSSIIHLIVPHQASTSWPSHADTILLRIRRHCFPEFRQDKIGNYCLSFLDTVCIIRHLDVPMLPYALMDPTGLLLRALVIQFSHPGVLFGLDWNTLIP